MREDRQGFNPFTLPEEPVYVPPQIDQDALDKALEAIKVRKEANDAATNATDQYEADVADFKNTEATEIEQGIASLPEILQLSEEPFSPAGIGGIPQPRVDPVTPREDFVFTPPPRFREEPVFTPPPASPVAAPEPVNSIPAYDFTNEPELDFFDRPDFDIPDFRNDIDFGGFVPPSIPSDPVIPPTIPGNPYEGVFDGFPIKFPPINFPPGLGDPMYPPYLPPEEPPYVPPEEPPYVPPEEPPYVPPEDQGPTGPVNYYTGQPLKNPYQPYATDSGAAPLNRQMTPQSFGQAPGFEKPPRLVPQPPPIRLPKLPPRRDDQIYVPPIDDNFRFVAEKKPTGAKNGKYLNKGISQLPMNGQGDTLTTQVFQAGFRPRR